MAASAVALSTDIYSRSYFAPKISSMLAAAASRFSDRAFEFLSRGEKNRSCASQQDEPSTIGGVEFNCLLAMLLDFRKEGMYGFGTPWSLYDEDHYLDMHYFFVVYGNKIVRERLSINTHDRGFDPTIFKRMTDSPIGSKRAAWQEAFVRFWYRKFCIETRTGQYMVMNSDESDALPLRGARSRRSRWRWGSPSRAAGGHHEGSKSCHHIHARLDGFLDHVHRVDEQPLPLPDRLGLDCHRRDRLVYRLRMHWKEWKTTH
jgi:hypothetical protein